MSQDRASGALEEQIHFFRVTFTFAGLWDSWKQPDGSLLRTYTIVTTEPNDVLRPIHNRMPAMLNNDDALKWLAVDDEIAHALTLLKPYPPENMEGYDVSPLVSNPRNDSPECIQPVEEISVAGAESDLLHGRE